MIMTEYIGIHFVISENAKYLIEAPIPSASVLANTLTFVCFVTVQRVLIFFNEDILR